MSDEESNDLKHMREQLEEKDARVKRLTERCRAQQERLFQNSERFNQVSRENKELREGLKSIRDRSQKSKAEGSNEFATFVKAFDESSAYVFLDRKLFRFQALPDVDITSIKPGQLVRLDKNRTIVAVDEIDSTGTICRLQEIMKSDDETGLKRLRVSDGIDDSMVVFAASSLELGDIPLKNGCSLLVNKSTSFAYEIVEEENQSELDLELVPDITYSDIGGLDEQIEQIYDEIEMPMIHSDLYKKYSVTMPKGVLLYGPPGCGKTMIAKAIANSIASKVKNQTGSGTGKAYFINIKGPELLNKYVGETERHIRELFQKAREKASAGTPVVVFFDEMESLFGIRGSGVSSDVEKTIVPQLLSEIDGVESMNNVLVIGASNREDMIDPAVLRPGRIDVKIEVSRPDMQQAKDIFMKYVSDDLPIIKAQMSASGDDRELAVSTMVGAAVTHMYREDAGSQISIISDQNTGAMMPVYYKDLSSGAMIKNIVDRAKKLAVKSELETGEEGLKTSHFIAAIDKEFAENKYVSKSISNADWNRISGRMIEKVSQMTREIPTVETTGDLVNDDTGRNRRDTEGTGQYL